MSMRAYTRALRQAYVLEVLGEATYRCGQQHGTENADVRWQQFTQLEAAMQPLLAEELRRVTGSATLPVRRRALAIWIGAASGWLPQALTERIIMLVLKRRRYAAWAKRFREHNPMLWDTLLAHECTQADYFERRNA